MAIDGLISGLDTTSIIDQLMKIERAPVDLLTAQKTKAQADIDAYESIRSKISAISTFSATLARPSGWLSRTATSSNSTLATVAAADGADTATLQFTVDRLATTHGVVTATDVADADTTIARRRGR
ncbi:MAG: flagellar cap protein FliD N-terminal domain-containing protein [Microthrixaceae bacterium]